MEAMTGGEHFARWREEIASVFGCDPADPDYRTRFRAGFRRRNLDIGLVGVGRAGAALYRRSEPLIAAVGVDHILIQLYAAGETVIDADGREAVVRTGDVVALDMSRPLSSWASEMANINMVLPRVLLGLPRDGMDRLHGTVLKSSHPLGGLAADHLRAMARASAALPADAGAALMGSSATLLSACFAPELLSEQDSPVATGATLQALRRFVERRLHDPELGAELLGKAFGLSRSSLYRLFAPLGGVSHYVRTRRLDRAALAIGSARGRGGVARLAQEFGFGSEDAFSRAFKEKFGLSPRAAAADRSLPAADGGQGSLAGWIRTLGA